MYNCINDTYCSVLSLKFVNVLLIVLVAVISIEDGSRIGTKDYLKRGLMSRYICRVFVTK